MTVADLLQFLSSGLTAGATYALVGLGFTLIYNASGVINFAQGEFVMIGGMSAVSLVSLGVPLPLAAVLAVLCGGVVGFALERLAIEGARGASLLTLSIITLGASIALRGAAQLLWDRQFHRLPSFSGEEPLTIAGATILPQSLWVLGVSALIVAGLRAFFSRTLLGKAMLAAAYDPMAAQLVGIDVRLVLRLCFVLAAMLGALAGVLITPIALTSYEAGILAGFKGFAAAMLGGLGHPYGAVAGGLVLGVVEALAAGYLSSEYKDAIGFVILMLVLFFMPNGLFGSARAERV